MKIKKRIIAHYRKHRRIILTGAFWAVVFQFLPCWSVFLTVALVEAIISAIEGLTGEEL